MTCYLQNTAAGVLSSSSYDHYTTVTTTRGASGRYTRVPRSAIAGYNIQTLNNVSVGQCEAACDQRSDCLTFDYTRGGTTCYLQNTAAGVVSSSSYDHYIKPSVPRPVSSGSGAGSGYRLTANTAISGRNNETLRGVSVEACQAACNERDWCKSFDYSHPGEHSRQHCYLQAVAAGDVSPSAFRTDSLGKKYDYYEKIGAGGSARAPRGSNDLAGRWRWNTSCASGSYSGEFELVRQGDGSYSGTFKQTNQFDMGTITNGRNSGGTVSFTRRFTYAGQNRNQQWSGRLTTEIAEATGASWTSLKIEGEVADRTQPNCTFVARKQLGPTQGGHTLPTPQTTTLTDSGNTTPSGAPNDDWVVEIPVPQYPKGATWLPPVGHERNKGAPSSATSQSDFMQAKAGAESPYANWTVPAYVITNFEVRTRPPPQRRYDAPRSPLAVPCIAPIIDLVYTVQNVANSTPELSADLDVYRADWTNDVDEHYRWSGGYKETYHYGSVRIPPLAPGERVEVVYQWIRSGIDQYVMPASVRAEIHYEMWWKDYGRPPRRGEYRRHKLITQMTESLSVPLPDLKFVPGTVFTALRKPDRNFILAMRMKVANEGKAPTHQKGNVHFSIGRLNSSVDAFSFWAEIPALPAGGTHEIFAKIPDLQGPIRYPGWSDTYLQIGELCPGVLAAEFDYRDNRIQSKKVLKLPWEQ